MPWDPFSNTFAPYDPLAAQGQQSQPTQLPPLQPQERDSLLQKVTGTALSGLGYVGGVLEKTFGGRALRGALGGKPGELLSIIPGSDTLGITDPANRVSGEDLLKQWGVLEGEGQKGSFEMRDLLGPALEIGLDPATYMTFGASALNRAGQAAKQAGTLAPSMAGRIAAGQGGLIGLGLPFRQPLGVVGTGPTAEKIAQGLGQASDWIGASKPALAAKALFKRSAEGTTSPILQPEVIAANERAAPRIAAMKEQLFRQGLSLKDAGEWGPGTSDLLRAAGEQSSFVGPLQGGPLLTGQSANVLTESQQMLADNMAELRAKGIPVGEEKNYIPRQETGLDQPTPGFGTVNNRLGQQVGHPFTVHQIGRKDMFLDIVGDPAAGTLSNTAGINQLAKDQWLRGPGASLLTDAQKEAIIRRGWLGISPADEAEYGRLAPLAANAKNMPLSTADQALWDRLSPRWEQAKDLREWRPDPQLAEKGLDFFGNNFFTDVSHRLESGIMASERASAAQNAIRKASVPVANAPYGAVPADHLARQLGMTMGNAANQFKGLAVPPDVAQQLTKYVTSFSQPEAMGPWLKAFDSITKLTKAGVTALWPAKYMRDFTQGVYMNWVHDAFDPRYSRANPMTWIRPYRDASTLLRQGLPLADANTIPGLTHLTPEAASRELAVEMSARQIAGPEKMTQGIQNVGSIHAAQNALQLPGEGQGGLLSSVQRGYQTGSWNPLGVAGLGEQKVTTQKLARAGGEAMGWIDDVNRGAAYIAKRRQGFAPDQAAKAATAAQYDYGNLAPFERSVMQRVVPFWSWIRNNLPAQVEQLIQKPGGKIAASMKVTDSLRHDQGFVPEHVGEGLAIPIGKEDETGKQRFLSHFGLPFEDAFSDLGVGPQAPQRTIQNVLSEMNPLIKAPLELAAGKQFFSGRDLEDLYGQTGNQLLDQALYNSPISRAITTGRTLLDERKGLGAKALNLLSPLRVTDVDLEKARGIAARDYVDQTVRGNPAIGTFERMYVRPGMAGQLSPEDQQLMQLYSSLESQRRKVGVRKP